MEREERDREIHLTGGRERERDLLNGGGGEREIHLTWEEPEPGSKIPRGRERVNVEEMRRFVFRRFVLQKHFQA